ncbi:MAG: hypothetical protein PHY81_05210, partial [Candidatus Bipolaricaulis anaerobius]|nr:hypothetical protein [Candidatus Bipolaricaulis anaerobius]
MGVTQLSTTLLAWHTIAQKTEACEEGKITPPTNHLSPVSSASLLGRTPEDSGWGIVEDRGTDGKREDEAQSVRREILAILAEAVSGDGG